MPKRRPEDDAQRMLMQWMELAFPLAFPYTIHVPNGGGRGAAEAGIFKALGVKPGVPDLLCFVPRSGYVGLAVELKAEGVPPSRVSPEQRDWIYRLRKAGWRAEAAAGFDAASNIIVQYLTESEPADWRPWGGI